MFDSQLQQEIPDGLKGYTYLIMQNGQVKYTRSHGYARSPQDGLQYWDEFQKMHVASISKTITTVATLRLLKMKGLSANELIYKYLPPDWQVGANVKLLRFRDLMSHRTGFTDVVLLPSDEDLSTRYDTLKNMVANGANGMRTRRYSNAHHALLRIILPVLEDYPYTSAPIYDEANTARRYAQIVKQLVFDPLDIEAALLDDDPDAGVLAYSSASDPEGVFETFDYTMTAGGYGWVLSARDVAKFWAYLWHTDVLLDASQRQLMRQTEMGLWNSGDTTTGRYYCKLGGWFKKDPDLESGLEHWLRSAVVEFGDGTAVVLFTNSPSGRGLRDIIVTAYEKAYGCFAN
ncbi:serine hydrolase domain-containing protein [Rhodothermus marinus]|uniref:serine hydrolase domain-containing protein n=1 Tax=Rhodothermus marinus TaxID=29549 RepID=UPI0037C919FC